MTEHELRMQYLILEDNYRKLEKRVAELELNLKLNKYLGLEEKFTNTSISLFLLRRDREKLSNDLGICVSDYASVKSFGEEALEYLIYEQSDILNQFIEEDSESIISEIYTEEEDKNINQVDSEIKEDNYDNISDEPVDNKLPVDVNVVESQTSDNIKNEGLETEINNNLNDTIEPTVKKTGKRGRKSKAEKEKELQKLEEEKVKKSEIKTDDKKEEEVEFENLEDALSMWA